MDKTITRCTLHNLVPQGKTNAYFTFVQGISSEERGTQNWYHSTNQYPLAEIWQTRCITPSSGKKWALDWTRAIAYWGTQSAIHV